MRFEITGTRAGDERRVKAVVESDTLENAIKKARANAIIIESATPLPQDPEVEGSLVSFRVSGKRPEDSIAISEVILAKDASAAILSAAKRGIKVESVSQVATSIPEAAADKQPRNKENVNPAAATSRRRRAIIMMQGVQVFLIAATLIIADPQLDTDSLIGLIVILTGLFLAQWLFLAPIAKPVVKPQKGQGWQVWISASVAGLGGGMLTFGLILLSGDFLWGVHILEEAQLKIVARLGLLALLASWVVFTPLVVAFMKRRDREGALYRLSGLLLLGTIVEFIASLPIYAMVSRKTDCASATASANVMASSLFFGFLLIGPTVLLATFSRRSRAGDHGHCGVCGYDLSSLTDRSRCPECGVGWAEPKAKP
ncbi:MAG: hypothetical protein AAGB51_09620 [Planctomycetota bacterium]